VTAGIAQGIGQITQGVRHPKAEGYNIRVGNKWYRMVANAAVPLTMGSRDSLAQRQDRDGSIYNNVLDIGYAWGRTDLSGGEGLDWDPREIALDTQEAALDLIRFWDSVGLDTRRPDTAGEQYSLRLARESVIWGGTVTDPKDLGVSDSFIYVADGVTVTWYESWSNITPIGSDTLASPIVAMAVAPNDTVMVTLEDGTVQVKEAEAVTFASAYTPAGATKLDAHGIWYTNGRFIMSAFDDIDSAQLWEIVWDGTDWEPQDGEEFDTASAPFWSVVESGPAIVAACGDGTVRTYTPDNSADGTFALIPRSRTTMPEGETPILLGSNLGVLLIFTAAARLETDREELRIYQAEVLDARFDYVVGQLKLKREWLGSEHEPLVTRNMTNTRDEIYWFVKEVRNGLLYESLWRMDLVTGGFNRVSAEQDINLNGIVIFDNITAGIDFGNINITLGDDTRHQLFGYMIFPNITFGLNTQIGWLQAVIEAHDLQESGAQIELFRSTDPTAITDPFHPSWVLIQRLSSPNNSNLEVDMTGLQSRTLSLQIRMTSTDSQSVSPKVTRIGLRGIPSHRDFIMQVPMNVSDYVSVPGRTPSRVPGLGHQLHTEILDLIGKPVSALVIDPPILFSGVINNVSEPITYLAERGSVTEYVMVEFRGSRQTTTSQAATGDAGMGLGLLGVATVGIGQTGQT